MSMLKWMGLGSSGTSGSGGKGSGGVDTSPLAVDGGDKTFGMENFGNTCYANSVLQALYFCKPFRDAVLSYPPITDRAPTSPTREFPTSTAPPTPAGAGSSVTNYTGRGGLQRSMTTAPSEKAENRKSRFGLSRTPSSSVLSTSSAAGLTPKDVSTPSPNQSAPAPTQDGKVVLNIDHSLAETYGMSESLFTALKDVFEGIVGAGERKGVIKPQMFIEVLRRENELFRSTMHQDAHEFLNYLLNMVVDSVDDHAKQNPTKLLNGAGVTPNLIESTVDHRWVHTLFEGSLTSETKCLTCETISSRNETFLDLSIDIEEHTSITSCLRAFSASEMLCEKNKFHCDRCNTLQEAEKRMKVGRLPRILALHLKRFKYREDIQQNIKLFHRVLYPLQLRLFNTTDTADDPDRLYELVGVVVHIGGGPYHGHYVAIVKAGSAGWMLFDDDVVTPVHETFVTNFFGDRPGLGSAYVLFYEMVEEESLGVPKSPDSPSFPEAARETETESTSPPSSVMSPPPTMSDNSPSPQPLMFGTSPISSPPAAITSPTSPLPPSSYASTSTLPPPSPSNTIPSTVSPQSLPTAMASTPHSRRFSFANPLGKSNSATSMGSSAMGVVGGGMPELRESRSFLGRSKTKKEKDSYKDASEDGSVGGGKEKGKGLSRFRGGSIVRRWGSGSKDKEKREVSEG
ncbi:cysteine proteinase [Saitoella complicata NRRL Y-17804]|uniref:Ubiquitin carboxyl-terminal hydrolase n=1 Tax=Saitoella complicata (strain BCRC 22490 / CBS 7301 / JCM 7358 / NBRC 10748 / NRRL Y-17804) TaxID=698492 RepID=A0A0E9NSK8_SAICN|nr:cysteine proteinase [Saitoella complicata NRRL Y-17804]ODQ55533.1 cysteine proteinase [Saitoella complicata NRRL Y-17804]GAO52656.1 hypothetical protein G7K_6728-t1 [Saitoella complicata NRRL Y-17804]